MTNKPIISKVNSESISEKHINKAINKISQLTLNEKKDLIDEIFNEQPTLISSLIIQNQLGNSLEDVEVLLHILLIIFQSLKEAKINIHKISETEYETQLNKTIAHIKFSENLNENMISQSLDQYIEHQQNEVLFAFVIHEMTRSNFHKLQHENSKYLLLSGVNLVACISKAIESECIKNTN
jgi:hypothetical protein